MSKLTVEEARGQEALDMLRREWQELFAAAARPSPFLSWEWISAWQRWLGRGWTPRLFCAREGYRLVGLLPLGERERWGFLRRQVRTLSFLGEALVGGDYLDVLAASGWEQLAATAIFEHLVQEDSFDVLELDGLAGDSRSLPPLAWQFGVDPRFTCQVVPGHLCPYLKLEGSWEDVLMQSRRPNKFKRLCRTLGAPQGFEARSATAPQDVGPALERLFSLHAKRWAAQGGSDAMGRPGVRDFHRDAAVRLAQAGLARIEELWIDGACRASYYGMEVSGHYYLYQTGYDPEWRKRSVAFVRLGLSIQAALARGVTIYDFLRGNETYKFDWANGTRMTVTVQVARQQAAANLFVAREQLRRAAKLALKAGLPRPGLELLRRGRRSLEHRQATPGQGILGERLAPEPLPEAQQAHP